MSEPTPKVEEFKTTALYNLHLEHNARMVPFAGYSMPVSYPLGVLKEHLHTRDNAGLFDVSHMGQITVQGPNVVSVLEKILPLDIEAMGMNQQTYTILPSESGGILDDLIVTRWEDDVFFLVINAACKESDIAHLRDHLGECVLKELDDRALMALQGPKAASVLGELAPKVNDLVFMNGTWVELLGEKCYVTRSGYTGEDGFEISVPSEKADLLARELLKSSDVELIGLGARDSLRLEAGLCLYGHDMDEATGPVEASILFSMSKSRRAGGSKEGGFIGAESILKSLADGADRKRVGLKLEGRAPVREGANVCDQDGNPIGIVTSGGYAPSLESPVAMAYVSKELSKIETELFVDIRGKLKPAIVSKMPFVPQRYHRG